MESKKNIKSTKEAYIQLIETYVEFGYDISKMLHPVYKNIDPARCNEIVNKLNSYNNK